MRRSLVRFVAVLPWRCPCWAPACPPAMPGRTAATAAMVVTDAALTANVAGGALPDRAVHNSLARTNSARNAAVACTRSIAFSAAPPSALTASRCSERNSIHSATLRLVMKR